jgi:hypothetical protein
MPIGEATDGTSGFALGTLLAETGLTTCDPGSVSTGATGRALCSGLSPPVIRGLWT